MTTASLTTSRPQTKILQRMFKTLQYFVAYSNVVSTQLYVVQSKYSYSERIEQNMGCLFIINILKQNA